MKTPDPQRGRNGEGAPADHDSAPETGRDPHFEEQGVTAEDDEGIGYGEEGFRAEEYPGHNALREESDRQRRHRTAVTWTWPRVDPEVHEEAERGEREDWRICREIGRRIVRAEVKPIRIVAAVLDGEVTLEGEVEDLDDKHVIEGVAESIEGVRRLESRLDTARRP